MALRRRSAFIGCSYRIRRGIRRTVKNNADALPAYPLEVIMLIEDITLSDYSNDELNKLIHEAQEVIRDRKNKQLYKKMDEFVALFNELTKEVYFTYDDDENGVTHNFELAKVTSQGQYPEITLYDYLND